MAGRSTNFYAYAQNAPINVKDPSGKILPLVAILLPLLGRSALGAAESVAFEVAIRYISDGELPGFKGTCSYGLVIKEVVGLAFKCLCMSDN